MKIFFKRKSSVFDAFFSMKSGLNLFFIYFSVIFRLFFFYFFYRKIRFFFRYARFINFLPSKSAVFFETGHKRFLRNPEKRVKWIKMGVFWYFFNFFFVFFVHFAKVGTEFFVFFSFFGRSLAKYVKTFIC